MYVLLSLIGAWLAVVVFFALYIAAINLWEKRDTISKTLLIAASPILLWMLVVDVLMNPTLFALLFWDLPHEILVTTRMKRYRALTDAEALPGTQNARRRHWAVEICTRALNPFAPSGYHC